MKKIYFICGCQPLYGDEAINKANANAKDIVSYLDLKCNDICNIIYKCIVVDASSAYNAIKDANNDEDCIGIITWMHTFSPAKMWIRGLKILHKPLLHLHTQHNEKLPYETIDMDFMNLNQSAHGDREFSFILTRMKINHAIAIGYYKNENVIAKIRQFAEVANAISYSNNIKCAMFGNNMRQVAVTDGDRVEAQIHFGWEVNYYALGDLCEYINKVNKNEINEKIKEYQSKYIFNTTNLESVKVQAQYDVALHKFLKDNNINAFTDTFEDLHGLKQLPGLAIQNLFKENVGFGPEGDFKSSCLGALLMEMAKFRKGATGFVEDYTYNLEKGNELELASHMLEVPPQFASSKPLIEVHALGIGGKEDPARLVFDSIEGNGIQVTLVDLGTHFRLIAIPVCLVKANKMPCLPVARITYKILPSFEKGLEFWLNNGGGHHSILSTSLTMEDLELYAKLTNTEFVCLK